MNNKITPQQTAIWLMIDLCDEMPEKSVKKRAEKARIVCSHAKQALEANKADVEYIRYWDEVMEFFDMFFV